MLRVAFLFDLAAGVENNNKEEGLAAIILVTSCNPFSLCEHQPSHF